MPELRAIFLKRVSVRRGDTVNIFISDMTVYIEISKIIYKLLELRKFSKLSEYKVNIKKSTASYQ